MLKRIIAPLLAISFALTFLITLGVNLQGLAQSNLEDQDYFIKFHPKTNIAIVEPNYGYFYHPDQEVTGDPSGQPLYQALDELKQMYGVEEARMIRFERKGQMIPNLYVFLKSTEPQEMVAEETPLLQS